MRDAFSAVACGIRLFSSLLRRVVTKEMLPVIASRNVFFFCTIKSQSKKNESAGRTSYLSWKTVDIV